MEGERKGVSNSKTEVDIITTSSLRSLHHLAQTQATVPTDLSC